MNAVYVPLLVDDMAAFLATFAGVLGERAFELVGGWVGGGASGWGRGWHARDVDTQRWWRWWLLLIGCLRCIALNKPAAHLESFACPSSVAARNTYGRPERIG